MLFVNSGIEFPIVVDLTLGLFNLVFYQPVKLCDRCASIVRDSDVAHVPTENYLLTLVVELGLEHELLAKNFLEHFHFSLQLL